MTRHRVIWSEGLFLRPQHFQQLERSFEGMLRARTEGLLASPWGWLHLQLAEEALQVGRVAIESARGILPDGTALSIPADCPAPPSIELPADAAEVCVHLALPLAREGVPEFAIDAGPQAAWVRYLGMDRSVADNVDAMADPIEMKVGHLNLRLLSGVEPRAGLVDLPVARVIERKSTGQLVLDAGFIPPMLACAASPPLRGFLKEARNLMRHRADVLASRLSPSAHRGQRELADLLLLQIANRFDACLSHLGERQPLHPEALYGVLVQSAGELATFSDRHKRRATDRPGYRHDDLRGTFEPLMCELRELLTDVVDPHAVEIPLLERATGLYTAALADPERLRSAIFVLAVHADRPPEFIRSQFPAQVKIGPPDRIRDLVRLHLPAIGVESLPAAPPRMPYYAGFLYFHLDRASELWKSVESSQALALHVAGDFPGLRVELWALKA